MLRQWAKGVGAAVRRARNPLGWVALAYAVGVSAGVIAVHAGSPFAFRERDRIVGHAVVHDAPSLALARGERVSAALFDFVGNLGRGAVPYTIMGLGVVFPLQRYTAPLLEMIEGGKIDPSFIISHRASLSDAPELHKTFRDKTDNCTKVVLTP